jgi:hypothetical protein
MVRNSKVPVISAPPTATFGGRTDATAPQTPHREKAAATANQPRRACGADLFEKLWRRPGTIREGMSGNLCRCGLAAALGALRRRAGLCFELLQRSVRANTGCRSSWSARLEHERPAAA